MMHLYGGSTWPQGQAKPLVKTGCGLVKAYQGDQVPPDVVMLIGAVTCLKCLATVGGAPPNPLSNGHLSGQRGKKAP